MRSGWWPAEPETCKRPDTTLFDIGAIRLELRKLLGGQVDVLTPNALPDKFRAAVLADARPV